MRQAMLVGNWKMHGSRASNKLLIEALLADEAILDGAVRVSVCPPFPYLGQIEELVRDTAVDLGAQNVSGFESGAYTGEVSASMLADWGCRTVIVGHSERRHLFGENNLVVAGKFEQVLQAGLAPVLCVGETLDQRQQGLTLQVVAEQLAAVVDRVGVDGLGGFAIAYEPVWAIGTGKTAAPEHAQEVHAHLRSLLKERSEAVGDRCSILYGGSVKGSNAGSLIAMADIDGALVGGASLSAEEFCAIARAMGQG